MMERTLKSRALHRAKILQGQIKGLIQALEEERYCVDMLNQSLSIRNSLISLDRLLLENHLKVHAKHQLIDKSQESRTIAELLKIYTLNNK